VVVSQLSTSAAQFNYNQIRHGITPSLRVPNAVRRFYQMGATGLSRILIDRDITQRHFHANASVDLQYRETFIYWQKKPAIGAT
jgi:hypothetical protein